MASKLVRLLQVPRDEQWVVLKALSAGVVLNVLVRQAQLSAIVAWLSRAPRLPRRVSQARLMRIAALVNASVSVLPSRGPCLLRSLALLFVLRTEGVAGCELKLGVRLNEGDLDAHAWVEHLGSPLNDVSDVGARFAAFDGMADRTTTHRATQ
jgi:hypothetical protein